ncbi:MAG: aldehyde dehydrogenase family protein [Acidobacteriota bacterium]|jgi:acetaldehyde dehydrogenase (acetylating)|nr:MAG: acetaldehyde dehydrogenase [Acidobacteriota bacterium]
MSDAIAATPQVPDRTVGDPAVEDARRLASRARQAAALLAEFTQEQIDRIVDAMAAAVRPRAEQFARMAVEETGFGVVADKILKNRFAAERVHAFIRPMRTVGVVGRRDDIKVVEIAEPFGVVAGIVPSTNPTSTAIYKILIALKARCPIVLSPHPSAARCITAVAEIMDAAAREAGAPEGSIGWMQHVSLAGTQALMQHRDVAVILATGGMGLVRAAYSAGKPAYGVGPGNAPCYVERSGDLAKAASDIVTGKSFDNGLLCSSPNSAVVDREVAEPFKRELQKQGAHFLTPDEGRRLAEVLVTPQRLPNPRFVGRSAVTIATEAGLEVPPDTRILVVELEGVGRDYPLSIEKLCPVLSFYVVADWREGCERCKQILRYGGMGHTMSIHSTNERIILEFGLRKPAFRIVVNTPTTHGSIGLTTGLDPAMTLGCGGYGGNITSDNISPRHLLNIKRLAWELRTPASVAAAPPPPLPDPPAAVHEVPADAVQAQIAAVLGTPASGPGTVAPAPPVDFVCEDDVRQALRHNARITITERTIVTPLARELGEARGVFVVV